MAYSPEQWAAVAQKYLDEKVAKIDRKYHAVDGLPIHLCQTGEMYVVFRDMRPAASKKAGLRGMVQVWYCSIERRAAGCRGGRLYWRTRPEIVFEGNAFRLYSRFCITNKPEIWKTLADYEANKPVLVDPAEAMIREYPETDDDRLGESAA